MIWLFCFIFAAVGGGVLIMLNKKKSREYSVTTEEADPGTKSELIPVKPPRNIRHSSESSVSSLVV